MLNSNELYDKIELLRIKKGLSVSELNKSAGISHATLNSWKKRGTMPKLEILENLCLALGYSLSALLCDEDIDSITSEDYELFSLWNRLDEVQKNAVYGIIKVMIKK